MSQPEATAIARKPESEYEIMDALDEQQIVSELKGDVIEQYFYEFQQGGRLVVGISWSGIKYVARKMSEQGHPISVEDVKVTETEKGYTVIATAMDLATKEKRWGASEAARTMTLRSGEARENPFAMQVAISKAQRNAIRNFIPEVAIQEGYKEWKQRTFKSPPASNPASVQQAPPKLQAPPDQPVETQNPMPELCQCGHQKRLHLGSQSGETVCMIGSKENKPCICG